MGTSLAPSNIVYFVHSEYVSPRLTLRVSNDKLRRIQVELYLEEPDYYVEYYYFVEKYEEDRWKTIVKSVSPFNPQVRLI